MVYQHLGLLLIIMFFLNSCRGPAVTHYKLTDTVIRDYGTYFDKKADLRLILGENNGLLKYSLVQKRDTIINQNENASIYQNWFVYMDGDKNLWICSSDIGIWVWLNKKEGYKKFDISNNTRVPKKFFSALPTSLREGLIGN
jgi:hypothetical protein